MLGYRQSGNDGKLSPATRKELNTNFSGRMKGSRTRIISYTPLPAIPIPPSPFNVLDDFNGETIETLPGIFYSHDPFFIEDFNDETIQILPGIFYSHDPFNIIEDFNGQTIETLPGVFNTHNPYNLIEDFNGQTIETLPGVFNPH
tara:strand:- start:177 stop:611 length:435 start_codon:yes stop_codon:yes gene_type:complete